VKPAVRRCLVRTVEISYQVSERRACGGLGFQRSSHRYRSIADPQVALRMRLRELAGVRVGWGYRRLHILLRREGWRVNHKRVWRLCRDEGLALRKRPPRRHRRCMKRELPVAARRKNECWSMDFMSDQLYDGRRFRLLTIVDNHSRESLAVEVGRRLGSQEVVRVLERVASQHGAPEVVRVDNGPEFISKDVDLWAYFNGVKLDFIQPGKPTDNAFIEAFNSRFRQECLNEHWFLSMEDAQAKVNGWREDYNRQRPHSALGQVPPAEYAARCAATASATPRPSGTPWPSFQDPENSHSRWTKKGGISIYSKTRIRGGSRMGASPPTRNYDTASGTNTGGMSRSACPDEEVQSLVRISSMSEADRIIFA